MTMDVQKTYQSYNDTSPENKGANLTIESARTSHVSKTDMQPTMLSAGKTSKRSFDVAFLMMPDEKPAVKAPEKQLRVSRQLFNGNEWEQNNKRTSDHQKGVDYGVNNAIAIESDCNKSCYDDRMCSNNNGSPTFGSEINIDVGTDEYPSKVTYCSDSDNSDVSRSRPNSNESASKPKFLPLSPYKNKIFDDPSLISAQTRARYESRYLDRSVEMSPKSAFTKVANYSLRSPNPSMSPDSVVYQDSVSPPLSAATPPMSAFNKSLGFNSLLTPAHFINGNHFSKGPSLPSSSPSYPESRPIQPRPSEHFNPHTKPLDPKQNKMHFLPFRPELPPYLPGGPSYPFGVQNMPSSNADFMKLPVSSREQVNPLIVNPAAAILSTLLPPTLAAFSLPAQNVCAKCNISFRMTSDLVYHMRTHHKSESTSDVHRRKREDKLKCPVCNESFRERHHLTRHMTAHQDKEGDMDDDTPQNYNKKNKQFFSHSSNSMVQK